MAWVKEVLGDAPSTVEWVPEEYRVNVKAEVSPEEAGLTAEGLLYGGSPFHEQGLLDLLVLDLEWEGVRQVVGAADYLVGSTTVSYTAPGIEVN